MLCFYLYACGELYPLEIYGGKPTVRDDLPEIISCARERGFDYIQLNTNGMRIAREKEYLYRLKEAGLTTIYLGFDGITEGPYIYTSGKKLLKIKLQALQNCARVGLAEYIPVCSFPGKIRLMLFWKMALQNLWRNTVDLQNHERVREKI